MNDVLERPRPLKRILSGLELKARFLSLAGENSIVGLRLYVACEALRHFERVKDRAKREIYKRYANKLAAIVDEWEGDTIREVLGSESGFCIEIQISPSGKMLDGELLVQSLRDHGLNDDKITAIMDASYRDKEPAKTLTSRPIGM